MGMKKKLLIPLVLLYVAIAYYISVTFVVSISAPLGVIIYTALMLTLIFVIFHFELVHNVYSLTLKDELVLDITTIVPVGTVFKATLITTNTHTYFKTHYTLKNGTVVDIKVMDAYGFFIDQQNKMVRLPISAFTVGETKCLI